MDPYVIKTDTEIKNIALGMYQNTIFASVQLPAHHQNLLDLIFMPILMLSEEDKSWFKENEISSVYGEMRNTLPRSINGYPIFTTIGYLNTTDTVRLVEQFNKILSAIENV